MAAKEPAPCAAGIQLPARPRLWIWPAVSCAIVLACILLSNPFNESGFCDDWSYGYVAMKLAATRHLQYSGWGNPMVLFQALWALPWIRLFGFSFPVLAASMVPIALAFVGMVYAVGREIGLRPSLAAFAAIAIGTCPLFTVLAGSFMTDACGCFFAMLCIYTALRSVHAAQSASAVGWLWWLALAGVVGGSNRQIVWAAPLMLIPYLLWARRRDSRFRIHAGAALAATICAILAILHFFGQPFSPMLLSHGDLVWVLQHRWGRAVSLMAGFTLMSILLTVPVLCCFWSTVWRNPARSIFLLVLSVILTMATTLVALPWPPYGNGFLTEVGPVVLGQDIIGKPPELSVWTRLALGVLVNFCVLAMLRALPDSRPAKMLREDRTLHVFAVFSAGYLALLMPGALTGYTFDRYMLPCIALFMLLALRRFAPGNRRIPVLAWLCCALFAAYGVAATHDYFNALRARTTAAHTLEQAGVPRNHISAGFEYDAWTEVTGAGHVEVSRYQDQLVDNSARGFWMEFWNHVPHSQPDFVILHEQAGAPAGGGVFKVEFSAWLPPYRRSMVVWRRSQLTGIIRAVQTAPSVPNFF